MMDTRKFKNFVIFFLLKIQIILSLSDTYKILRNTEFPKIEDSNLIGIFEISERMKCFAKCNMFPKCALVSYQNGKCTLLKRYAYRMTKSSTNSIYCRKFCQNVEGLINYWPIYNSLTTDIVEGKNLYAPVKAGLAADRFGNLNASLSLNDGHYQVPSGVYFSGDFTVTAWAKVTKLVNFGRLFDFGSSSASVLMFFSENGNGHPGVDVFSSNDLFTYSITKNPVPLNNWFHIASVLNNGNLSLYLNGTFQSSHISIIPTAIVRNDNYIGKSNLVFNADASADIDDFKIFNRALSPTEIFEDFSD